jgi:hypothetical protein
MSKDDINEILDEIFGDDKKMKSEIRKVREQNAEIGDKNTIVPQIEMPLSDMHIGAFKYGAPGIGKGRTAEALAALFDQSHNIADNLLEENKNKKTFEYEGKEYELRVGSYPMAPLAMFVAIQEKGNQDPSNEKVISVCLGNYQSEGSFVQPYCTFIDVNNSPDAIDMLEKTGLAEPYVKWGAVVEMQSGFVSYPVYQFNQNMLKELDPQGCEKYMEDWGKQCQIEQDKMNDELFGPGWREEFDEECL